VKLLTGETGQGVVSRNLLPLGPAVCSEKAIDLAIDARRQEEKACEERPRSQGQAIPRSNKETPMGVSALYQLAWGWALA
jgi:hypothetical protein